MIVASQKAKKVRAVVYDGTLDTVDDLVKMLVKVNATESLSLQLSATGYSTIVSNSNVVINIGDYAVYDGKLTKMTKEEFEEKYAID